MFHTAAQKDDVKSVRQALTASLIDVDTRNQDGQTALHVAACSGSLRATKYLCQREACLSSDDMHGRTPLHYAAMHNHAQVVKTLLSYGAKDSKEDDDGIRAIDYAKSALVEWFLTFGIGIEARDPRTGYTALMHCSVENHVDASSAFPLPPTPQKPPPPPTTRLLHPSRSQSGVSPSAARHRVWNITATAALASTS